MPAPEEQGYELEPSHGRMRDGGAAGIDPPRARDRPAAGSAEDLAQRQNRLLPGHPSSRFEDDGTPKPPLVPLKNLELPEPGEDRERGGAGREQAARNGRRGDGESTGWDEPAADAETAGAEMGGTETDGTETPSTETADAEDVQPATLDDQPIADNPAPAEATEAKRAEALTPEQVRIAVRAHGRCRLAEGRSVFGTYDESGLTPAMRRIEENLDHGQLVPDTEKYALKSLDRFQEKLAKQIARNPDKTPEELAHEIHDGVRYSFVFDEVHYYDATWQAHSNLEEQGFDLEFRRNTWTDPEYKGINSRWHDSTHDTVFEVQFHTAASFDAKQRTHDAYQRISDTTIPTAERARLRDAQKEISATVPLPPRCSEIPDYHKEGK